MTKSDLRFAALAHRNALSADQRAAAAAALAAQPFPIKISGHAIVAGYAPMRSEIDPTPLMRSLAAQGACIALPSIVSRDAALHFRTWRDNDALTAGLHGTSEPPADAPRVTPDIVLVPLAAFDRAGHRIGYGGGYYDRTLAALRAAQPITAIGLAFAVQEVGQIPADPHDARLDFVLTEREAIDVRS